MAPVRYFLQIQGHQVFFGVLYIYIELYWTLNAVFICVHVSNASYGIDECRIVDKPLACLSIRDSRPFHDHIRGREQWRLEGTG
jgi:hypothetical protein